MKKLNKNQIGPWCSFCSNKERAVYRSYAFLKFSCEDHIDLLRQHEEEVLNKETRMKDADYQTWSNL